MIREDYVVYDAEIIKAILSRGDKTEEDIEYCAGWGDFAGMGISVLGAYDGLEERYRVFCADNMAEFFSLLHERQLWVTYGGDRFDNKLIEACSGHQFPPHQQSRKYDILTELYATAGLDSRKPGRSGYKLTDMCERTLGYGKTGHGSRAPIDWQRKQFGRVLDYNLCDVWLTARLLERILQGAPLQGPDGPLTLRHPFQK